MDHLEVDLVVWDEEEVLHRPLILQRVHYNNILQHHHLPLHLKDRHLNNNKQCKVKDLQLVWFLRNQDNSQLQELRLQLKVR